MKWFMAVPSDTSADAWRVWNATTVAVGWNQDAAIRARGVK